MSAFRISLPLDAVMDLPGHRLVELVDPDRLRVVLQELDPARAAWLLGAQGEEENTTETARPVDAASIVGVLTVAKRAMSTAEIVAALEGRATELEVDDVIADMLVADRVRHVGRGDVELVGLGAPRAKRAKKAPPATTPQDEKEAEEGERFWAEADADLKQAITKEDAELLPLVRGALTAQPQTAKQMGDHFNLGAAVVAPMLRRLVDDGDAVKAGRGKGVTFAASQLLLNNVRAVDAPKPNGAAKQPELFTEATS